MDALFEKRMKSYLPEEYEEWKKTLDQPLYQGVRISPLKQEVARTQQSLSFLEEPSCFASNNWYIHGHHGLDPAHLQGLIYFQEPSASSAVTALEVQPGDRVLDLCAAPGSKSTQIAEKIGDGFLLSNEYDAKRAQILLSNLERMGAENMMVTNMDTKDLADQFTECFDRVLVDAPCSGEGMMKKHAKALDEWSYPNILLCAARQKDILKNGIKALRPGGVLVYSTCTYAKEENEEIVAWILENYPEMEQEAIPAQFGREGLPGEGYDPALVRRIFPMDKGEGHFVARFRKKAKGAGGEFKVHKNEKPDEITQAFLNEQLDSQWEYFFTRKEEDRIRVFAMNHPFLRLKKGKLLRQGVYVGDVVKKRFEPALAFYLSASVAKNGLTKTETTVEEMDQYYHGQQLPVQTEKGYRALCWKGIPYGFGKSDGNRITNKLPKGLRLLPNSHICFEKESEE